jgi:hypothetical protein
MSTSWIAGIAGTSHNTQPFSVLFILCYAVCGGLYVDVLLLYDQKYDFGLEKQAISL